MHCEFFIGEHRFTSYPKRLKIKESAREYLLSVDTPQIGVNISNRLKYSMPLSDGGGKGDVYDQIDKAWLNTNFIIQEACLVSGKISGHLDSMNFCVSFPIYKGENDKKGTDMWIDETVMNALVSHKLKKRRFVFEKTIVHKDGWRHRCAPSQIFGLNG